MPDKAVLDGKEERDEMRRRSSPVCYQCANWERGSGVCDAFPIGIPDAIFIYGDPHTTPYPGDNGIRFEQILASAQGPGVTNK